MNGFRSTVTWSARAIGSPRKGRGDDWVPRCCLDGQLRPDSETKLRRFASGVRIGRVQQAGVRGSRRVGPPIDDIGGECVGWASLLLHPVAGVDRVCSPLPVEMIGDERRERRQLVLAGTAVHRARAVVAADEHIVACAATEDVVAAVVDRVAQEIRSGIALKNIGTQLASASYVVITIATVDPIIAVQPRE